MKPFDIFVTYISWDGGGKKRPVLAYIIDEKSVLIYQITTQYGKKSESIKAKYFKIDNWSQAGLDMQSYIDTGTVLKLPLSVVNDKTLIGELSTSDKQRLIEFIKKRGDKNGKV